MIQFNLLPDVKQEYLKARRQKHSVIVISLLVAASSLFIFIMLLMTVYVFQTDHLKKVDNDIAAKTKILKDTQDLDKILTIQNQLVSLPGLHSKKPETSRLFKFISQTTPAEASVGKIDLDFATNSIQITGTSDSLGTVNKYIDTLKFTTYQIAGDSKTDSKPFGKVVMSGFTRTPEGATFQISMNFDIEIFDVTNNVTLVVPKSITTRSETEKPKELFKAIPERKQNGENQ